MTDDTPRIYVVSLHDYVSGRHHGAWIDASQDPDDIFDDIQDLLDRSPSNRRQGRQVAVPKPKRVAEEWAIRDYEGFEGLSLGEYESIEDVAAAAQLIEEYGAKAGLIISHAGGLDYVDDAREILEGRYMGSYEDLESWAMEHLEDALDSLPEELQGYFDYESYGRDADLGGSIFTVEADGELHVFSN